MRLMSIGLLCIAAVARAETDTEAPRLEPPPRIQTPARSPSTAIPPPEQSRTRPDRGNADDASDPPPSPSAAPDPDTYVPHSRTATGSLLEQVLPPPPRSPAYAAAREDVEHSEPGELLILSPDLPHAVQVQQFGQGLGLAVKRRSVLPGLGLVVTTFRVPRDQSPARLVQQLRMQVPELWIDLNHRFMLQEDIDPRHYPVRLLGWPGVAGDCGRGLRIGLVDGPLPERHPALEGADITRRSFVTHGVRAAPPEHALAVAAILVGREGRGLVPSARLFSAEVMRLRDREQVDTTVDWLVQGLDWLAQQQMDLINLSLGGPRNLILAAAVQRVLELDIPVVAAAGNLGAAAAPLYPAAQEGVIAVTAIDAARHLYRHASRGDHITFAAPGVDIWVPRAAGAAFVSGTSFAAPHITALLAARRHSQPHTPWTEHLQALIDTAEDLGEPGRDALFGFGLPRAGNVCATP